MRLLNIYGKLVYKNVNKFRIEWDEKSRSNPQFKTKQFLKKYWFYHIVYEEFPVYGTLMKIDFLNATKKIAIEVNGSQHSSYSKFFHGSRSGWFNHIKRDFKKLEWLESNGYTLLEIEAGDVDDLSLDFLKTKFDISII